MMVEVTGGRLWKEPNRSGGVGYGCRRDGGETNPLVRGSSEDKRKARKMWRCGEAPRRRELDGGMPAAHQAPSVPLKTPECLAVLGKSSLQRLVTALAVAHARHACHRLPCCSLRL